MMKFKFLLAIILLSSFTALAQSSSKILKQAEKALGGAKAMQSVHSWQKTGSVTRLKDGTSGKFTMQASRPNLYNLTYDLNGFEVGAGYNGKSGWERDSRRGLRTLTGDASLGFQAEAAYRNALWLNYKKEKSKIVSGGQKSLDGKLANVLLLNTAKGITIKLFFDAATGLLVREEIPAGDALRVFDYADYRTVNGLKQPFRIKMSLGDETYKIRLDDIELNPQIARADFDFPRIFGEPLPEIKALLKEVQDNEDKVDNILDTYSFVEKSISREIGKDGVLREKESETFQLSFYKGFRINRLIEKNGKPLNTREQEKADKDAGDQVAKIEKEIAKQEAKAESRSKTEPPHGEDDRISIAELFRASKLSNPRRERFRERDVIVFDFEPDPNFDYKNAKSMLKLFGKTAGVMWIDEKDKQVARLEAFLFDSYKIGGGIVAKLKKGASFTLEQERVNDEIWLPSSADINLSVRLFLVKGIEVNELIKSYDYRKFRTEVKDAKVDELPKPQ